MSRMRTLPAVALFLLVLSRLAFSAPADQVYQLGPDSAPHPGVHPGEVVGPTTLPSNAYPNTTRNHWVYVVLPGHPDLWVPVLEG